MWSKYDIVIDDTHARIATTSYDLCRLSSLSVSKEKKADSMQFAWFGGALGLAILAWQRLQNMPYETGISTPTNFKFVILLFVGGLVCFGIGIQRERRPSEVRFHLKVLLDGNPKTLYSHSDPKIVQEIKSALESASKNLKR